MQNSNLQKRYCFQQYRGFKKPKICKPLGSSHGGGLWVRLQQMNLNHYKKLSPAFRIFGVHIFVIVALVSCQTNELHPLLLTERSFLSVSFVLLKLTLLWLLKTKRQKHLVLKAWTFHTCFYLQIPQIRSSSEQRKCSVSIQRYIFRRSQRIFFFFPINL